MTTQDVELYSYFRSSCSWRVRIALELKGIEYEYKAVNLLKGEQKSDSYVSSVNAMPQVPSLVHNGNTIAQSIAIMEYLEEVFPTVPLLPKDPVRRAHVCIARQDVDELLYSFNADNVNDKICVDCKSYKVREIVDIVACDIQPVQNLRILQYVGDEKKMEHGKHWIDFGFQALEKKLQKTAGKYCVGDEITMADLCLVPQCHNASRFSVDMTKFPTISRINTALEELEAFKKADYKTQPDCPEDLR